MRNWVVSAPLMKTIVPADTSDEARTKVLHICKLDHKPYLARDWEIHEASPEEVRLLGAQMDAYRPSQRTVVTAKGQKKPSDRLL